MGDDDDAHVHVAAGADRAGQKARAVVGDGDGVLGGRLPEPRPLVAEVPVALEPLPVLAAELGEQVGAEPDQGFEDVFQGRQAGADEGRVRRVGRAVAQRRFDAGKQADAVDDHAAGREAFQAVAVVRTGDAFVDKDVRAPFHRQRLRMGDEAVANDFEPYRVPDGEAIEDVDRPGVALAVPIERMVGRIQIVPVGGRVGNGDDIALGGRPVAVLPERQGVRHDAPAVEFRQCRLILADDDAGIALVDEAALDVPDVVVGHDDDRLAPDQVAMRLRHLAVVDDDEIGVFEFGLGAGRGAGPVDVVVERYAVPVRVGRPDAARPMRRACVDAARECGGHAGDRSGRVGDDTERAGGSGLRAAVGK